MQKGGRGTKKEEELARRERRSSSPPPPRVTREAGSTPLLLQKAASERSERGVKVPRFYFFERGSPHCSSGHCAFSTWTQRCACARSSRRFLFPLARMLGNFVCFPLCSRTINCVFQNEEGGLFFFLVARYSLVCQAHTHIYTKNNSERARRATKERRQR